MPTNYHENGLAYILENRAQGIPDNQTYHYLLQNGWEPHTVNLLFQQLDNSPAVKPAPTAPVKSRVRDVFIVVGIVLFSVTVFAALLIRNSASPNSSSNSQESSEQATEQMNTEQPPTTQTLTSSSNFISFSYPDNWELRRATENENSSTASLYSPDYDQAAKELEDSYEFDDGLKLSQPLTEEETQRLQNVFDDPRAQKLAVVTITAQSKSFYSLENTLAEWREITDILATRPDVTIYDYTPINVVHSDGYRYKSVQTYVNYKPVSTDYIVITPKLHITINVFPGENEYSELIDDIVESIELTEG